MLENKEKYSNVNEYIEANWDNVIRVCREDKGELTGLPYPFTVPAVGHFESLYYWDTYFTNIGLLLCGRAELAKSNTDNILYLVNKFGYMPNSNARVHLDHSQPPFLSLMVSEVYAYYKDKVWLCGAYEALKKEYSFWMEKRATPIGLNRYDTNFTDDTVLAGKGNAFEYRIKHKVDCSRSELGRHYMGTCESGYDCSSRFEFDIYNYAPVCLNSLMYSLEANMACFARELSKSEDEICLWSERAKTRKKLMRKYMLDECGAFRDYNYVTGRLSKDFSCASVYPLFCGVADERNAEDFMKKFNLLETDYGVLANEKNNAEGIYQWGYPNGWACHQMMVVAALDKYGYENDARRVAKKYVMLADKVFDKTQNLWEKYNVIEGNIIVNDENQKGMPPMMGWTAGVYLYMKNYVK